MPVPVKTLGTGADVTVFKQMNFSITENSICYGDKAYNDYNHGDILINDAGIIFKPFRKKNSLRATDSYTKRLAARNTRKRIILHFLKCQDIFFNSLIRFRMRRISGRSRRRRDPTLPYCGYCDCL